MRAVVVVVPGRALVPPGSAAPKTSLPSRSPIAPSSASESASIASVASPLISSGSISNSKLPSSDRESEGSVASTDSLTPAGLLSLSLVSDEISMASPSSSTSKLRAEPSLGLASLADEPESPAAASSKAWSSSTSSSRSRSSSGIGSGAGAEAALRALLGAAFAGEAGAASFAAAFGSSVAIRSRNTPKAF